jgi:hypothetical protein
VSCLEMQPTFSEIVNMLLRAKSFITCKDEMIYSSEIAQAETTQTKTEGMLEILFLPNGKTVLWHNTRHLISLDS